jgi:hypothetical protein
VTPKASDLAARLAATAAGSRPATPAEPVARPPVESRQATSPIQRFTINMPKAQHRFIRQFALASDSDVSTIIRLLLDRIEHDPVFAEEVRGLLRTQP